MTESFSHILVMLASLLVRCSHIIACQSFSSVRVESFNMLTLRVTCSPGRPSSPTSSTNAEHVLLQPERRNLLPQRIRGFLSVVPSSAQNVLFSFFISVSHASFTEKNLKHGGFSQIFPRIINLIVSFKMKTEHKAELNQQAPVSAFLNGTKDFSF